MMLSRALLRASTKGRHALRSMQAFNFSSEDGGHRQFTPEELEAGKETWGIKYDDECLKFEKEWKEIADKVEGE